MADRLSGLPEELISDITHRLGDDKFALRATCRAIEKKSFREFATEHFSRKCVHFTTDSLNILREISGSVRLSGFVKEVSLVTALFSEQGFRCPGSTAAHWKPNVRQSEAYKFYIEDQKTLKTTGSDRAILAECFKNLSALKTVAFIDNTDCLKDDTDYRGGNKVLRQTGTHPINGLDYTTRLHTSRNPMEIERSFRAHLMHMWSTIVAALADSHGHLSLEEFRTNMSSDLTFINPLKQLSFDAASIRQLSEVFRNTTKLHLHLSSPERKGYKDMLVRFTRTFSNVKDLSLDFDIKKGSGPVYQKFASGIDMSKLTTLNILGLSVDATRLTSSITRLQEITDLRFYCVDVASGSWPPVLKAIANLEKLEHLHLMYLREGGHKSYFLKQRVDADGPPPGFGPGMANWADDHDLDDDDDDMSTDESMPELQPTDDLWEEPPFVPEHGGPVGAGPVGHNEVPVADEDAMSEYAPRDFPRDYSSERGFYVCIEGHDKIAKRLNTFIDEYNVGEYMDENDDGFLPPMGPFAMGHGVATVAVNGQVGNPLPAAMAGALLNYLAPPPGAAPAHNNNPAGANGNPFTGGGAFVPAFGGFGLHHPPPPTVAPAAAATTATTATTAATPAATAGAASGWDLHDDQDEWEDAEDDENFGGEMD